MDSPIETQPNLAATAHGARPFDKYELYLASVQAPEWETEFADRVYADARGADRTPEILREDFCGTFANCCAWVQRGDARVAYGVDLDPEPLSYGRTHHLPRLTAAQQARVHVLQEDVLGAGLPASDIICAQNFSYFVFKERATLLAYFRNALATLRADGILVLDVLGGSECQEANETETPYKDDGYRYFWAQEGFDPLTHHATFHIHFQRDGEPKRERVFTYDWRMWTIPELREALLEAGFRGVNAYWEGTAEDGSGDGNYFPAEKGEECQSWIAYLVALK
jgi:SAM-dependent methyltransferase